jgi:hypothetical protein
MKRQLPGLSEAAGDSRIAIPDGVFLVRIDSAQYRWHAQKPFYVLRLSIVEPKAYTGSSISSRLYCTPKAMWKLGWFLRDFIYDPELLSQSEVDEKALRGLVGVVKISHTVINGRRLVSFDGFACQSVGRTVHDDPHSSRDEQHRLAKGTGVAMNYSYTQISQYLTCPRPYRHRYLDGWQEKDVRAAMLFGRAFEQAVAALFRREDPASVLFEQWSACKTQELVYSGHDTWDSMLQQGVQLLERFVQDGRVRIRRPKSQQQVQFTRKLGPGNSFVSFVDAIGELDGTPVCSNGRHPLPGIQMSRLASLPWTHSWFATPG